MAMQPAGMLFIETMGAYLLARCYIRDASDFERMLQFVGRLLLILSPFAVYEWVTGSKPILSAFSSVFPTLEVTLMQPRWGFFRVQGPFSHSIEFGLFCSSIIAISHLALCRERSGFSRWLWTGSIAGMTFLSMSSAPIGAMVLQTALLAWNFLLRQHKNRWKILWALLIAGYLIIEFGSNQTPFQFYISHFTFEQQTGWYRIWIWEYGSASVVNHPLFGIGLSDWARPSFMFSASVDNFWLLTTMRHGIPAIIFMASASLLITLAVARRKGLDERLENYRLAYLVCICVFLFVGCTIHFTGAIYVWFLFLLGSGAWLLDADLGGEGSSHAMKRNAGREKDKNFAGRTGAKSSHKATRNRYEWTMDDLTAKRFRRARGRVLRSRSQQGLRIRARDGRWEGIE